MATFKALRPVVVEGQRRDVGDSFEGDPESMGALVARGYVEQTETKPKGKAKSKASGRRKSSKRT